MDVQPGLSVNEGMQQAGYIHTKAHRINEAHGVYPLLMLLHQSAGDESAVAVTDYDAALEVMSI